MEYKFLLIHNWRRIIEVDIFNRWIQDYSYGSTRNKYRVAPSEVQILFCFCVIVTARKRSFGRLCFYTCLSVHGGGQVHLPGRYSACWDTVNKRAVRIPLECILVAKLSLMLLYRLSGSAFNIIGGRGNIGGSKVGARDSPSVQFLLFPCSFRHKFCQIIDFLSTAQRLVHPHFGKSWIRYWLILEYLGEVQW